MTTKITYAMFAIAAVAALSIGLAPAAISAYDSYVYSDVENVPSSGTASSSLETGSCGTGTCVSKTTASASQDYVTAWYGMYGSNNVCDVTTTVNVTGEAQRTYDRGTIAGLHSDRVDRDVDAGDDVVVVNYYDNCS